MKEFKINIDIERISENEVKTKDGRFTIFKNGVGFEIEDKKGIGIYKIFPFQIDAVIFLYKFFYKPLSEG